MRHTVTRELAARLRTSYCHPGCYSIRQSKQGVSHSTCTPPARLLCQCRVGLGTAASPGACTTCCFRMEPHTAVNTQSIPSGGLAGPHPPPRPSSPVFVPLPPWPPPPPSAWPPALAAPPAPACRTQGTCVLSTVTDRHQPTTAAHFNEEWHGKRVPTQGSGYVCGVKQCLVYRYEPPSI